jgi:hypothetical protein
MLQLILNFVGMHKQVGRFVERFGVLIRNTGNIKQHEYRYHKKGFQEESRIKDGLYELNLHNEFKD